MGPVTGGHWALSYGVWCSRWSCCLFFTASAIDEMLNGLHGIARMLQETIFSLRSIDDDLHMPIDSPYEGTKADLIDESGILAPSIDGNQGF